MSIEKLQPVMVSVPTQRIAKIPSLQFNNHRPFNASQGGLALEPPRPVIKPPQIGVHAAPITHQSESIAVTGVRTMSSVAESAKFLPPLLSFTSPPQSPANWSPSPVQYNNTPTTPNERKSSFLTVPSVFPNDFRAQLTTGPCYSKEPCPSLLEGDERISPDVHTFEIIQERSPTVVKSPESLSDCTTTSHREAERSLLFQTGRSLSLGSLPVLRNNNSPPGHTGNAGGGQISPSRTSPTPRRNRPVLACSKPARHTGRCTFSPNREDLKKALVGGQPSTPNNRVAPTERQMRSIHGDQIQLYNFKLTPSAKKTRKARETNTVCCLNRQTVNGTLDTTPTAILNQKTFLNGLSKVSRKKISCREQEDVKFPSQILPGQRDHVPSKTVGLGCSLPRISQTPALFK